MSYYYTELPIGDDELRRWDDYLAFIEDKDINKVNGVFKLDLITFLSICQMIHQLLSICQMISGYQLV